MRYHDIKEWWMQAHGVWRMQTLILLDVSRLILLLPAFREQTLSFQIFSSGHHNSDNDNWTELEDGLLLRLVLLNGDIHTLLHRSTRPSRFDCRILCSILPSYRRNCSRMQDRTSFQKPTMLWFSLFDVYWTTHISSISWLISIFRNLQRLPFHVVNAEGVAL